MDSNPHDNFGGRQDLSGGSNCRWRKQQKEDETWSLTWRCIAACHLLAKLTGGQEAPSYG